MGEPRTTRVRSAPTVAAALARLDRLGSAEAIAQHLIDLRCTGTQGNGEACPVARFVAAATGEFVDATRSRCWFDGFGVDAAYETTPDNVAEFIERFDGREWPELVGGGA